MTRELVEMRGVPVKEIELGGNFIAILGAGELDLISTWISNYIRCKVWDEIIHPFPNFNGCTVEVWSDCYSIPHCLICVFISLTMLWSIARLPLRHHITVTSHEYHDVSNPWKLNCLSKNLFSQTGSGNHQMTWWRHQMETFSALLALCAGNSPVPVNSPHKGQWRGALMFSLIYACISDLVNNR